MLIAEIIFWVCVLALFHSYVVFPLILKILSIDKKPNQIIFSKEENLPGVSILIAAYNEEKVIEKKIRSIFSTDYPLEKLEVIIGSDGSVDGTISIVENLQKKIPQLVLKNLSNRKGKPNILNEIEKIASQPILIFTDANVFFESSTIFELVKNFKNTEIGLVGANVLTGNLYKEGISEQEKTYIQRENIIKYREGIIWGTVMGAFGACYAIRKELIIPFRPDFIVDDFFITMHVLSKEKKAIIEKNAKVLEDVSTEISQEFNRKVRISSGNFQNLFLYFSLLLYPFSGKAFCFFSHKILRWFGPFFIIISDFCNFILIDGTDFYFWIFIFHNGLLAFSLMYYLLTIYNNKIDFGIVKFISYFYAMNFALLVGFIKYINGIKTTIWQPTERNQ